MTGRGWKAQDKADNLVIARLYVKLHAPYLSPTLFGLIPKPVPNLRAIAGGPLAVTERLVMLYEPAWVEEVPIKVLATGLGHEVMHCQLRHVTRGKSYADKKRWNIAGDLFINGAMRGVKHQKTVNGKKVGSETLLWTFPEWAHMPEDYGFPEGLTADAYYRLLEEFEGPEPPKKPSEGEGDPGGTNHIMRGCCGGAAGNSLGKELEGAVNEEKGRSDADVHAIAKATAKAIKTHMESIEGRGSLPGQWSEFVNISDKVFRVPWRVKLANIVRYSIGRVRVGGLDYSMRRPSKRSYLRGLRLPSLVGYDPEIWFIVDSSGSMGQSQLADTARVCSDVLQQSGIQHAWWMEADTEHKREPIRVSVRDLRNMEIRGRGGTDFRPAIRTVAGKRPKPHIVIYITDGDGPAPKYKPDGIHFIWVVVPSPYRRKPANWGDLVVLEEDDGAEMKPLNPPYDWPDEDEDVA